MLSLAPCRHENSRPFVYGALSMTALIDLVTLIFDF